MSKQRERSSLTCTRGFTLVEILVVVAVVSVLATMGAVALSSVSRTSKLSAAKYSLMAAVRTAKKRAVLQGVDTYLVLAYLDSETTSPSATAPRAIVYEDPTLALRTAGTDSILAVVTANPGNVRDTVVSSDRERLAFIDGSGNAVSSCDLSLLPLYAPVSVARRMARPCGTKAWCTFCEKQGSVCVGVVRYSSDGTSRIITGGVAGEGGMVKVVDPENAQASSECLAFSEPNGLVVGL